MDFPPGVVLILIVSKGVSMPEGIADELMGVRLSSLQSITKTLQKWSYSWELVLDSEGSPAIIHDDQSETGRDWLRNNTEKLSSASVITTQKVEKCSGIVVPSLLGFLGSRDVGKIAETLANFVGGAIEGRRVVVMSGYGLALTFAAKRSDARWVLSDYCVTSVPIIAQFSESYADSLPFFMEETVRELGGTFVSSANSCAMLVDRRVVTVQNDANINLAVHAFCALLKEGR